MIEIVMCVIFIDIASAHLFVCPVCSSAQCSLPWDYWYSAIVK